MVSNRVFWAGLVLASVSILSAGVAAQERGRPELPPGFTDVRERPATASAERASGNQMPVAGTRVRLVPPPGFTPSTRFPGYGQQATGASLMVTELPGPVHPLSAGFSDPAALAKRGMTLLGRQSVELGGRKGLLLHVGQSASGTDYRKWVLLLGDGTESVMVTAAFPRGQERTLSDPLKASVLTTRWDQKKVVSPGEGLTFAVTPGGDLKLAKRVSNMLLYTRSGAFPSPSVDDPVFLVGPSLSEASIPDPEAFSNARVLLTASLAAIQVESSRKIAVDGLSGYEIVARAKDAKGGRSVTVYQATVFEGQAYYILQGIVSAKNGGRYLPVFRATTQSFRRAKSATGGNATLPAGDGNSDRAAAPAVLPPAPPAPTSSSSIPPSSDAATGLRSERSRPDVHKKIRNSTLIGVDTERS